jgi:dTDP-4-dehydrorhamnose 3,5-epimerase
MVGNMSNLIHGVVVTPLKQIKGEKGNVYHALKASEATFSGFGEAYFSFVNQFSIKGWKMHYKMKSNIVVIRGEIRFVLFDGRKGSQTYGNYEEIKLGPDINYSRLTIEPGLWLAFQGLHNENCLLNIASIEHEPTEALNRNLNEIPYDWRL